MRPEPPVKRFLLVRAIDENVVRGRCAIDVLVVGEADWRAAGIDATEAVGWREFGYELAQVRKFKAKRLGPTDAFEQSRTQVMHGGASVSVAAPLAGPVPGMMHGHPVHQFMQAGIPPQVMHSYMMRQWFDDDAVRWAKEQIDAGDALMWRELGLTPAEAGRLTRQNQTPMQVIREWWNTGVPLPELAEWIGAGLTAQEAAAPVDDSKGRAWAEIAHRIRGTTD